MRTFLVTLLAACAPLITACVTNDETFDLTDSGADGKSDSISGKRLRALTTGEVRVAPSSTYRGELDVKTIDDRVLEVHGPSVIVRPGVNRVLDIKVNRVGLDLLTHFKFVAQVREVGDVSRDGGWTSITLDGAQTTLFGGVQEITINYFDWLRLDPAHNQMSLNFLGTATTTSLEGFHDVDTELRFFVFPESGWGSLDGHYKFELELH